MSDEQQVPVWHEIVGEGWEPVQIGDTTEPGDEILRADGWCKPSGKNGFVYYGNESPRRRRKPVFQVLSLVNSDECTWMTVKPGDCLMLIEDGSLIKVDKPQAEGQVQS